jgi:hypothetical protein
MKVNRLEAHDRLKYLIEDQSKYVQQGAEDCLKKNPLSLAYQDRSPYVYIYGHARTHDNGVDKRLLWEPRLTKPLPQSNSYLFRALSKTDTMEVCWVLPPSETWSQYKKGNVVESDIIGWSIFQYHNKREELGAPFPDDLPDDKCKRILLDIAREMEEEIAKRKVFKPKILEAS